jgi:predicted esterase
MKKLLYFHGYWSSAERSLGLHDFHDFVKMMADEMIAFDAPFPVGDGYKWFTLPEEGDESRDVAQELAHSCEYIKQKIRELKVDESELTLFGASQGGFMALYLTLNNIIVPAKTIAAVPFYPRELANENINKTTPILWANAGRDERITGPIRDTWRDLRAAGAKVDHILDPESTHNEWSPAMMEKIIEWSKSHEK